MPQPQPAVTARALRHALQVGPQASHVPDAIMDLALESGNQANTGFVHPDDVRTNTPWCYAHAHTHTHGHAAVHPFPWCPRVRRLHPLTHAPTAPAPPPDRARSDGARHRFPRQVRAGLRAHVPARVQLSAAGTAELRTWKRATALHPPLPLIRSYTLLLPCRGRTRSGAGSGTLSSWTASSQSCGSGRWTTLCRSGSAAGACGCGGCCRRTSTWRRSRPQSARSCRKPSRA